jgi:ribonuclease BN (tRNA processing enzyme)
MNLTILGSGDAFSSGGRYNTCLKLASGGEAMLIDCGATSMHAMNQAAINRNAISTLLFTHFHGDHFAGLPFFLLDGRFVSKRTAPLLLAGPKGIREHARQMVEATFPGFWDGQQAFPIETLEITPAAPAMIAGFRVEAFPALHDERAGPCLSFRIERNGKVFAFSGDTAWTDALPEVARAADLFLCECYTAHRKLTNHLDWNTIEARRSDISAKRLILTHMGPEMLAFDAEIPAERAFDGMEAMI